MSRCFPFPPPGYEKRASEEGIDLLPKEEHKEKKHTKEKDKEKREGKERKDKGRSKDKHREQKENKERHRARKEDEDNNNDNNRISEERRLEGRNKNYNREKLGETSHGAEELTSSQIMELLDRKVRFEGSGSGNQMVEKSTGTLQRRIEGMGRLVEKINEGEERKKDKEIDVKKGERKRHRDQERRNKGKDKDRDHERRNNGKEKDRDRAKEKEKEKVKLKGVHDELRASAKNKHIDAVNIKLQYPFENRGKISISEGNLGKRKDIGTNGCLHEIDVQPYKLPQTDSSPHLPLENGRRLETCQITIPCTSGIRKVDSKEPKVNGIIETLSYRYSPSVSVEARENGEASTKPPHPDSKYLSRILAVPKMEELSDVDAQDWLFSSDGHRSKPTLVSKVAQEPSQIVKVPIEALALIILRAGLSDSLVIIFQLFQGLDEKKMLKALKVEGDRLSGLHYVHKISSD